MDAASIMLIIWLCLFFLSLFIEAITEAIVSIWFAIGAAITFAFSFIPNMPIWAEILVFLFVSFVTFLFFRKKIQKTMRKENLKTNIETLEGKKGRVTIRIPKEEEGEVRVDGILWTAISSDKEPIEKDSIIEVVSLENNVLTVKKTTI